MVTVSPKDLNGFPKQVGKARFCKLISRTKKWSYCPTQGKNPLVNPSDLSHINLNWQKQKNALFISILIISSLSLLLVFQGNKNWVRKTEFYHLNIKVICSIFSIESKKKSRKNCKTLFKPKKEDLEPF